MANPRISIHTERRNSFDWKSGYADVNHKELQSLLHQSREITASLEAETRNRELQSNSFAQNSTCLAKLHKTVEKLRVVERLDHQAMV